jgi:1,4-alpha-glucan branching enzyme
MPVKEYPGDHSWGYNPRYFFATESSYGTTEELKQLIDECHGKWNRVSSWMGFITIQKQKVL